MHPIELKKFALFETLPLEHLRLLSSACEEVRYPEGHVVFKEGDQGDRLYLIADGCIRISQRVANKGEEALAHFRRGEYFGDMSLIDSRPRSADAIVVEPARLYTIDRPTFLRLLKEDAEFAVHVMIQFILTLTARMRVNNEKIRALNLMAMW